jgi:hypothetical protein
MTIAGTIQPFPCARIEHKRQVITTGTETSHPEGGGVKRTSLACERRGNARGNQAEVITRTDRSMTFRRWCTQTGCRKRLETRDGQKAFRLLSPGRVFCLFAKHTRRIHHAL